MIKKTTCAFVAGAVMALNAQSAAAEAHGEITVAYDGVKVVRQEATATLE